MTGDIKYLRLQDVRKGMQFYEEDGGRAVLCEATEDAHEINENGKHGWQCIAKVISGDSAMVDEDGMVTLFECYNPGGYGLNLYQQIDASKPPATTVGETPMTDAALRDWRLEHYDRRLEMVAQESRTLERSLTAAQLQIDRLKAEVAKLENQLARTPTRCNEEPRK